MLRDENNSCKQHTVSGYFRLPTVIAYPVQQQPMISGDFSKAKLKQAYGYRSDEYIKIVNAHIFTC